MTPTSFYIFLLLVLLERSKGQSFEIKSHFMNGDMMFTWSHESKYHDVSVTCDGRHLGFTRVYDNKFVLKDILNYNIVKVLVRATIRYTYVESRMTFHQSVLEVTEGSNVTLYIPIPTKAKTLCQLTDSGASIPRYAVSAEDLATSSGLFTFVLSNVSATDAGYYALGYDVQSFRTNHGVVLVVNVLPDNPKITGIRNVPIGQSTILKCHSISRSRPLYFKKFPAIVYTWMVNSTVVQSDSQTLTMNVTSYTYVQCQATEQLTSISNIAYIQPLYGPEAVTMTPDFNTSVKLHNGASFGPVSCMADCNPPCTFQWRKVDLDGTIDEVITTANLPRQTVNSTEPLKYQCVAIGDYKNNRGSNTVSTEINIDVQYLAKPTILRIINGSIITENILQAKEGASAVIQCSCAGNPKPKVYITGNDEKGDFSWSPGKKTESVYSYHKLKCEHTKEYTCDAYNDQLNHTSSSIHLFVECSPRLDVNTTFSLHYQENIDGYVVLKVPLISYPKPKDATWFGPRREQFQLDAASTISQGDKPYQFWIHSEIHIINKSSFGYYKLFVEGEEILTIIIENKESTSSGLMAYLSTLPLLTLVTFALGGTILLFCFISTLCYIGRKYKRRQGHHNRKTSVISSELETGPMQNGTQSFQRYTLIPGRGVIEGDYETIDTPDDSAYLSVFYKGNEIKHSQDGSSFSENTSEAETCTYELEGRIYYCVTETSNSCKEKGEYEKLPTT
nr:uncharacterized protein LOC105332834 [Crassostrea gigas]